MILGTSKNLYDLIIEDVINKVFSQEINPGDKLPSVREQAKIHKMNPQTIQKAYNILIDEGIVISKVGSGNYLTEDKKKIKNLKEDFINYEIKKFINTIDKYNIDKKVVIKKLEENDA